MSISQNIRTGVWTNYNDGPVFGATITLTDSQAIALISFLAVLITHTGGRSFKVLRYVLHQSRNHESPRDAFARQQDLLLCNGETDTGVFARLVQMAWKWRAVTGTRAWRRSAGLAAAVFLHFACWLTAGVASSFVAESRDTWVTVKGEQCGAWMLGDGSLENVSKWQRDLLKTTSAAQAYVRLCYGEADIGKSECRVFPRRSLEWSGSHNTSCPWPGMCVEGPNSAFTMDTGLQSSAVFGINSKAPMQWQRTMTCAPLVTDGYRERRPKSGKFGEDVTHWNYGPISFVSNSTHYVSDYEAASVGLKLNVQTDTKWIGNGTLTLSPIPELSRPDGQLTILFFSSLGLTHFSTSDDPIFPAHTKLPDFTIPGFDPFPTYHTDEPATALGCHEQMRLCNPRTAKCTPFASGFPMLSVTDIAETANDDDVATMLSFYVLRMSVFLSVISAGATVLALNDRVFAGAINSMAREQWKVEASHLFDLGLATAQSDIVQAAKMSFPQDRGAMINALPERYNHTCRMVVFHEAGFTSISLFGLALIVVASAVVTALSFCEDTVGARVWGVHRTRRWKMDGVFWLLRALWERRGVGTWKEGWSDVPVTLGVEKRFSEEWKEEYDEGGGGGREKGVVKIEKLESQC